MARIVIQFRQGWLAFHFIQNGSNLVKSVYPTPDSQDAHDFESLHLARSFLRSHPWLQGEIVLLPDSGLPAFPED